MKKKVPRLKTDKQAEAFLAKDLSNLDFSQFKPARFEFQKKSEQINMRLPKPLLAAVKAQAKARRIPYTRFIRETLERAMAGPDLRLLLRGRVHNDEEPRSTSRVLA